MVLHVRVIFVIRLHLVTMALGKLAQYPNWFRILISEEGPWVLKEWDGDSSLSCHMRTLHFYETFSGVGNQAYEVSREKLNVKEFDYVTHRRQNIFEEAGLRECVRTTCMIVRFGGHHYAPVCKSWGFLNSSNTRRHLDPTGDVSYSATRIGNRQVDLVTLLMRLDYDLEVYSIVEQPSRSVMFKYPPMAKVCKQIGCKSYSCAMGNFYGPTQKSHR